MHDSPTWRQRTGVKTFSHTPTLPSLVQLIACRLIGAKSLSDTMLEYCWLDTYEQNSVES